MPEYTFTVGEPGSDSNPTPIKVSGSDTLDPYKAGEPPSDTNPLPVRLAATDVPVGSSAETGWGSYTDTAHTSGSPQLLAANTDTLLLNNAGSKLEVQKPLDVTTFYDGSVITGRNGDGIGITVDINVVPTSVSSTLLEIWFDIGGAVGPLYRRPITFPKGNGVLMGVNFTVIGYTLDTWEANGAQVYVRGNGTFSLYGTRYVITRTHKAR